MAQQQQPFVTSVPTAQVLSAAPPATRSNYNQTGGKVTGWIQIICGVASIIFGICMWLVITGVIPDPSIGLGHLIVFIYFGWLSGPIWCGVIFIVSGSLGAAAKKESTCLIGGYMAMSIVSIFFASGQLFYESIAASFTKCNPSNGYITYDYYGNDRYDCPTPEVYYGMHVGSALAAFVQIVVAIAGSVLCCKGSSSCCGGSTPPTQQVNVVYTNQPQQQAGQQQVHVVTQQQGQPGPYPPGPYPPGPYPPAYAPQQQANYQSASAPHGYQQKV